MSNEAERNQVVRAFAQTVEVQRTLAASDMQFVSYLLDMAKLEMATRAAQLIGASAFLDQSEAEMIRWFKRKVAEDIEPLEHQSPPN